MIVKFLFCILSLRAYADAGRSSPKRGHFCHMNETNINSAGFLHGFASDDVRFFGLIGGGQTEHIRQRQVRRNLSYERDGKVT